MLALRHINKTFNANTLDEKFALQNIELSLERGDFVTVIGSNGAGKSTLMSIISGAMSPDSGEVLIDNKKVTLLPEHIRSRLIGRVFQDPMAGTAPSMTIEENLAIAYSRNNSRSFSKGVTANRRELFKTHLKTLHLGLENRMTTKVGLLSGGERQALSLLMATFTEPHILLLDEHTAALDPSRTELLTNLTREIVTKYKLTTLMITHNMQQALTLGNKLIMMDEGKIIFAANEIKKKELTIEKLLNEFQSIKETKIAISDRTLLC